MKLFSFKNCENTIFLIVSSFGVWIYKSQVINFLVLINFYTKDFYDCFFKNNAIRSTVFKNKLFMDKLSLLSISALFVATSYNSCKKIKLAIDK